MAAETLDDFEDLEAWRRSFHWLDRPDRMVLSEGLAAELGIVRAVALRRAVPVCGCLPGGLAFLLVTAAAVARSGFGWPEGIWAPVRTIVLASLAALAVKLGILVGSWLLLRALFPEAARPARASR